MDTFFKFWVVFIFLDFLWILPALFLTYIEHPKLGQINHSWRQEALKLCWMIFDIFSLRFVAFGTDLQIQPFLNDGGEGGCFGFGSLLKKWMIHNFYWLNLLKL